MEVKRKAALVLCAVCKKAPFKYRCPKCEAKTCSLDCVNQHKTQANCDGVRQRSEQLPMSQIDENVLLRGPPLLSVTFANFHTHD